MQKRRVKVLAFRCELLLSLFQQKDLELDLNSLYSFSRLRIKDVPDDAKILHCWMDVARNCGMLTIEHPSFDEVEVGEMPPFVAHDIDVITVNRKGEIVSAGTNSVDSEGRVQFRQWT